MSLITKVKAGSVSSLSDARYFAGMGVDWLGFNVDTKADNFVNLELYKNLTGWISGPKRVIEIYSIEDEQLIKSIISNYSPDYVEANFSQLQRIPEGIPIFLRTHIDSFDFKPLTHFSNQVDSIILYLGENSPYDQINLITQFAEKTKVLLSVSPNLKDVRKIVSELPIYGLALEGSIELKTGLKTYDYSAILESLDAD